MTHVVSAAQDLGSFFPKFNGFLARARADGRAVLELGWRDDPTQALPRDQIADAARFIHAARRSGSAVLIICAQVEALPS